MKSYPLPEHEVLEYPHNCYGWDYKKNAAITTMSEAKIRKELAAIQKHERFLTVWEVDGIDQRHMDRPLPFPVRSLRYFEHGFALSFPSRMVASTNEFDLTWFDLWRAADALARLEGLDEDNADQRHIVSFWRINDDNDFIFHLE